MLVFIDESGDCGMKLSAGSSRFFTITLLIFEDRDEANTVDARIQLLKGEMKFPDHFEFHFANLRNDLRAEFLKAVAKYDFYYCSTVINKAKLTGKGFQFADSFYKYACGLVFENAKPRLKSATVVIDGSGSRQFQKQLSTYLRKRVASSEQGAKLISKIKLQNSRANNLLQLADMICGAVARSYGAKRECAALRKLISPRELDVQFWPR
jgi:Protein of unknown function (DUF3800)